MKADFNDGAAPPPRWRLDDLFPGRDSPQFAAALKDVAELAGDFAARYKGKIASLTGDGLADAIESYEKIADVSGRISAYASLVTATDNNAAGWRQGIAEKLQPVSKNLLFFGLELCKMEEHELLDKLASPKVARYIPFLRDVRADRKHILSDELESFMLDLAPASTSAWVRLYNETTADLRFEFRGKTLTGPEIASIFNTSPDARERQEAWAEHARVYGDNKKVFSLITNTIADIKSVDDRWRGFDAPESARHLANQIEPEVVDAMVGAVRQAYPRISHRYYAWKAKTFGVAKMHPADRNAPLPGKPPRRYTWAEARETVLGAFDGFSPQFSAIAKRFFDEDWIDAQPRAGKRGGAFSASTVPSVHPFILTNFFGSPGDVKTLAHELGHGVHQTLAAKQGALMSGTPLTLAETASVFGEMVTFRAMIEKEPDPSARRVLIADKIEDMLNTIVRQTAFHCFEKAVHDERREKGELSPERLNEIYVETQKESLGPAIDLNVKGAGGLWAAIPHFVHTPFYVYAYSTGGLFVNALYETFEQSQDKDGFRKKYIELLEAGGTKRHKDLLAPFGLDATDPAFWQRGLKVIERYIDDLIALDASISPAALPAATPPSGKEPGL